MRARWTAVIAFVCLGTAAACQVGLTAMRGGAGVTQAVISGQADDETRGLYLGSYGLYLPRGGFAARALGFLGGIRADMYWLKAAHYAMRQLERPEDRLPLLDELYGAMLESDPYWYSAAVTGGRILAAVSRDPKHAGELLRKAIEHRPREWRLWYELAGIYLFWPGHEGQAADAFRKAADLPGAPGVLLDVVGSLYSEAGRHEMAKRVTLERIQRYTEQYGADSAYVRSAVQDLKEFEARMYQERLSRAAGEFRRRYGRLPGRLRELVDEGLVDEEAIHEPYGRRWLMDPKSGTVVSEGLGILEGIRMRAILSGWVQKYRRVRGRYPESVEATVEWVKRTDNPEAKRLFGNPPQPRPHPVLGRWDYDPASGKIALPGGYRLEDLFGSQSPDSASPRSENASPTM